MPVRLVFSSFNAVILRHLESAVGAIAGPSPAK